MHAVHTPHTSCFALGACAEHKQQCQHFCSSSSAAVGHCAGLRHGAPVRARLPHELHGRPQLLGKGRNTSSSSMVCSARMAPLYRAAVAHRLHHVPRARLALRRADRPSITPLPISIVCSFNSTHRLPCCSPGARNSDACCRRF